MWWFISLFIVMGILKANKSIDKKKSSKNLFKKWALLSALTATLVACNPSTDVVKQDFERKDLEKTGWVDPYGDWWHYRWWKAQEIVREDGTKIYRLTKNEIWFLSSMDGTYYPEEFSEIWIKPNWDTTGVYYQHHKDKLTEDRTDYVTKSKATKSRDKVIPKEWWDRFEANFGELNPDQENQDENEE